MKRTSLVLLVLAAFSSPVMAGSITITGEIGQNVTVYAPGTLAATGVGTTAGAFLVTGDYGTFDAYCVDLFHYISVPGNYTATTDSMLSWPSDAIRGTYTGISSGAQAAWLYNTYSGSAQGNAGHAALQLAIWEVLYDFGDLDVTSGPGFSAAAETATLSNANALLANLPEGGYYGDATWFELTDAANGFTQDLIGVPDGGTTLTLLGAALVGLGVLRRKYR